MTTPWHHDKSMTTTWQHHDVTVTTPWRHRGDTVATPWRHRDDTMMTNDDTSIRNLQLFKKKNNLAKHFLTLSSWCRPQCRHGVVTVSSWCRQDNTHETYRVAISTKTWVACICTLYTLISDILKRIFVIKRSNIFLPLQCGGSFSKQGGISGLKGSGSSNFQNLTLGFSHSHIHPGQTGQISGRV